MFANDKSPDSSVITILVGPAVVGGVRSESNVLTLTLPVTCSSRAGVRFKIPTYPFDDCSVIG